VYFAPSLGKPSSTETDEAGRFEMGVARGMRYGVAACGDAGILDMRSTCIAGRGTRRLGPLVLTCEAVIEGVAVHPDGSPVVGVELEAQRPVADRLAADDLIGFVHTPRTRTDHAGRFRFASVRAGARYRIAPVLEVREDSPLVAAGARDVRIVVK
jgi:hypothetical protein